MWAWINSSIYGYKKKKEKKSGQKIHHIARDLSCWVHESSCVNQVNWLSWNALHEPIFYKHMLISEDISQTRKSVSNGIKMCWLSCGDHFLLNKGPSFARFLIYILNPLFLHDPFVWTISWLVRPLEFSLQDMRRRVYNINCNYSSSDKISVCLSNQVYTKTAKFVA